ncbi:hypothetical protein EON65_37950 [archaeon]|nr:MAG: hypothetical protein EON65_37950 [archaeon]
MYLFHKLHTHPFAKLSVGGNLCSIDYQPSNADPQYFTKPLYSESKTSLSKWSRVLPPGGEFMPSAAKYFSPQAVWTRFPHAEGNSLFFLITQTLDEYLKFYSTHLKSALPCTDSSKIEQRRAGIKDYLNFRTVNDPAKNILNKAFGESWTHSALTKVVFPLDSVQ